MVKKMSKAKLEIKNLYKIFGVKDTSFVSKIREGMTKQELLDEHNHVLGLNNINLSIPEQKVQVMIINNFAFLNNILAPPSQFFSFEIFDLLCSILYCKFC